MTRGDDPYLRMTWTDLYRIDDLGEVQVKYAVSYHPSEASLTVLKPCFCVKADSSDRSSGVEYGDVEGALGVRGVGKEDIESFRKCPADFFMSLAFENGIGAPDFSEESPGDYAVRML